MTNIQAINLLKGLGQSLDDYCELNDEGKTAFRMAIAALELFGNAEQLPSAQPEKRTEERAETYACDLIGRQAAIEALNEERCPCESDYDEGYLSMLDKAIWIMQEWLPSAQPEQRWIPCSERLPRQGQEVICQCRANMINVLKLDGCGDWYQDAEHCYMSGFVIAWMPLPEPYKEGEQDG